MFKKKDFRKKIYFRKISFGRFPLEMVWIKTEVLVLKERDCQPLKAARHHTWAQALESGSSGVCDNK